MTQYAEAMGEALAQARMARSAGDVPVGAVVLDAHGEVIGRGRNLRERDADPLAHAEIVAMREAAAVRGVESGRLHARRHARAMPDVRGGLPADAYRPHCVRRLGCQAGGVRFGVGHSRDPHVGHEPEVYGGVCERECTALLAEFFHSRRHA